MISGVTLLFSAFHLVENSFNYSVFKILAVCTIEALTSAIHSLVDGFDAFTDIQTMRAAPEYAAALAGLAPDIKTSFANFLISRYQINLLFPLLGEVLGKTDLNSIGIISHRSLLESYTDPLVAIYCTTAQCWPTFDFLSEITVVKPPEKPTLTCCPQCRTGTFLIYPIPPELFVLSRPV